MLAADAARQVEAQADFVADALEQGIDDVAKQASSAIEAAGETVEGIVDDAPRQTAAVLQQVKLLAALLPSSWNSLTPLPICISLEVSILLESSAPQLSSLCHLLLLSQALHGADFAPYHNRDSGTPFL